MDTAGLNAAPTAFLIRQDSAFNGLELALRRRLEVLVVPFCVATARLLEEQETCVHCRAWLRFNGVRKAIEGLLGVR